MPTSTLPDLLSLAAALCAGIAVAPAVDRAAARLCDPDGRRRDAPLVLLRLACASPLDRPASRPVGLALRLGLPLAFVAATWLMPDAGAPELAARLLFIAALALLALADSEDGLLPDAVTLGGTVAGLAAAWGGLAWVDLSASLAGAVACGGIFLGLAVLAGWRLGRDALGFGDVKLAALLGAWCGFEIGMLAFACGAIGALVVAKARGTAPDAELRFGPWVIAGLPAAVALRPALDALTLS
jgi:prepilin signal peptidase PulO-like enzyme (type II secretory pathway)